MHNYLTPEPITCEVRNAAGAVTVDLTDTTMTTVELLPAKGYPGGFLDDMVRSVWGNPGNSGDTDSSVDAASDVVVEFRDNKLMVDTEPARRRWHTGFVVRVTAPTGSGIRTRTESANIAISGTPDRVEVKTASGAVQVETSGHNTVLRSVSGDIGVREATGGSLDMAAVSGSLSVGVRSGVAAKVDLATVAGKARSDLPVSEYLDGSSLTIKGRTVSGNIALGASALSS